jgi:tRNA-intron endonuclease
MGKDGRSLYEQSGYGRPEKEGIRLAPQEALYLLHRHKIEIPGYRFDTLLSEFADQHNFLRSFLVYRDLRERGYVVQTGPHDFRVFRRGDKPGTGESLYSIRVLSERDPVQFATLIEEVVASRNMRKQYILAVVDDENELTYYEIKLQKLAISRAPAASPVAHEAELIGKYGMVTIPTGSDLEAAGYGQRLDDQRLLLSPVELYYLTKANVVAIKRNGMPVGPAEYIESARDADSELLGKLAVYTELREAGFTPRTGYKFGHHFRVYGGKNIHSDMLVHAIGKEEVMPMSVISRSVRMAHSVKKKMLFGCVHSTGIQFVEFARIKL